MEDKIVKPGYIAYQFRVDLDKETGLTRVMEFMKKYDVQYYICGAEVSDLGKHHFQCILWFNEGVNTTKLRNWWKGKTLKTKQPVSLTSAKKIKNLSKYAMKENNFITNLTKEELEKIGKWAKKVQESEWSERLDKWAEMFKGDESANLVQNGYDSYTCSIEPKLNDFLSYMLDFYKTNYRRPSRATLQYLAWKHGYMTNNYLISKWF